MVLQTNSKLPKTLLFCVAGLLVVGLGVFAFLKLRPASPESEPPTLAVATSCDKVESFYNTMMILARRQGTDPAEVDDAERRWLATNAMCSDGVDFTEDALNSYIERLKELETYDNEVPAE